MNEEEIKHLASLAKLNLTDEEVKKFAVEMKDIIEFCNQINNINTDGVEISASSQEICNVFREDIIKEGLDRDKALQNCQDIENGMFRVPKTF